MGLHEQPILEMQMARQEGHGNPHQSPRPRDGLESMSSEKEIKGKVISFQKDNTTAVAYLMKKGKIHCKKLNGLVKKRLLTCYKDRVVVCPEYL